MNPVLVADIGGTNARFALADPGAPSPLLIDSVRSLAVADFPGPEAAARQYLAATGAAPARAVFAVAALVDGDTVDLTNHPWRLERAALLAALGLESLRFVNDFEAQARALPLLAERDLVALGGGPGAGAGPPGGTGATPADGTWAVLGAGTGLGVAGLLHRDGRAVVVSGEGGHVGVAPGNAAEAAVVAHLAGEFGRVSAERLLSGSGLANIHRALSRSAGAEAAARTPAAVTAGAAAGDPLCRRTLALFVEVFGAVAGDVVLTLGAWNGAFLTGGLVPRLLEELRAGGFRRRFEDKGRFADAMARVPVHAVVHPQPGLLGAAAIAGESRAPAAAGPAQQGKR